MPKKKNRNNHKQQNRKINQDPLEALLTSIEKELSVQSRDKNSPEYSREVKRLAEMHIQQTISRIRDIKTSKTVIDMYKFDSAYQKRRISAAAEYAAKAAERFGDKYPALDIEDVTTRLCSSPLGALPDNTEKYGYIVLACAIFMLDELTDNLNIDEALLYIPSEKELISEIDLPEDFCDACYENEIIKGMIYLIIHRNDSEKYGSGLDPFMNPISVRRTYDNTETIQFKDSEMYDDIDIDFVNFRKETKAAADKMTYRERFDKILSFIRPTVIKRATDNFEDKMWELIDIIYSGVKLYNSKRVSSLNETVTVIKEMLKLRDKALTELKETNDQINEKLDRMNKPLRVSVLSNALTANADKINDILNSRPQRIFSPIVPTFDTFDDVERDREAFHDKADKLTALENEQTEISYQTGLFIDYSLNSSRINDSIFEEVNEVCRDEFENFRVINPYEICFAMLYLIDSGSNIPWLGGPAGVITDYAAALLPWNKTDNEALNELIDELYGFEDEFEDEESVEEVNSDTTEDNSESFVKDNSEAEKIMYAPVYTDYCFWAEEEIKRVKKDDLLHLNFPQFIYSHTAVNIPRKLDAFEQNIRGFKKSGFSPKHINFLRMYLLLGQEMSFKKKFPVIEFDKPTEAEERQTSEELKKVVADRNEEISRLKKELHKAESEAEQERKKAERAKDEYEADRQELIELRELVYKLQNSAESETEEENTDISLPYNSKSRIIIYGGHASWLRAIRPLLPNVRFIEPSTNPDANLIRNADVVWMQANAMPHSFYNKIMEIARQRKIPVKYFAYASAEKCARQLAASETE